MADKEMAPVQGPFPQSLLVVPAAVTLDDYRSVAAVIVPPAMQSAVMLVELGARRTIIPVAIIVPIAPDAEAETIGARHCGRRNCDRRYRG